MMRDDSIVSIIRNKIDSYDKMLSDIMESENADKSLAAKYRYYVMCLTELYKEIFFKDHTIFELLRDNYEKHDTEFIFMDGSSYTVKKDDICSFKDNYVLINNKEDFERNPTEVIRVDKALNLDNVKIVQTLS